MKKHIVKALKWALSKFEEPKPIEASPWNFPVVLGTPPVIKKKRITVPKATTHIKKTKPIAKKSAAEKLSTKKSKAK